MNLVNIVICVIAMVLGLVLASAFLLDSMTNASAHTNQARHQTVAEIQTCFYGQFLGRRNMKGEWHHFVTFSVNMSAARWIAYGPWPTDPHLWNLPNRYGYAEAGYQWPFDWVDTKHRPSDFKLCGSN